MSSKRKNATASSADVPRLVVRKKRRVTEMACLPTQELTAAFQPQTSALESVERFKLSTIQEMLEELHGKSETPLFTSSRIQRELQPWDSVAFAEALKRLPPVAFYSKESLTDFSQERFSELLREKRLVLPIMTAQHENLLLAQAGTWRVGSRECTFPPCVNGEQCYGLQNEIPGLTPAQARADRVQWMGFLYEREYHELVRNNEAPPSARPCILCCRNSWTELTIINRHARMVGEQLNLIKHPDVPHQKQSTQIVQMFANTVDQPNGYHSNCVMKCTIDDPIIQPYATPNMHSLRAKKVKGRWMIDQSELICTTPLPTPRMGESVSHF